MERPLYQIHDDDDRDSLYTLPDGGPGNERARDIERAGDSPADLALVDDEEEEEDDDPYNEGINITQSETPPSRPWITGYMLRVMFGPIEGWKRLKRAKLSPEEVASHCFYPLVGLAALSEFAALWTHVNVSLTNVVVSAVTTFISFFFGYFLVLLLGGVFLPKRARELVNLPFGKEFIMISMATLALFLIIYNVVPLMSPVLVFLPLWTIYIMFRGVRLLRVAKDCESRTTVTLCTLVIGSPALCCWLLTKLLPTFN